MIIRFFETMKFVFFGQRYLVRNLVIRELKARYRTSILGVFWSLLVPLSTLAIYTFVFSVVLKSTWQNSDDYPYAFLLFAGFIPFTLFSDVINQSPSLILGHPNYVKKIVFPLHILSIVAVGTALVDSFISTALLLTGIFLFTQKIAWSILLLPILYIPLLLMTLGASWFLSSVGVYIRDIGMATNIFTRLWFFLTPIIYPLDRVPEKYQWAVKLNPLTFIVQSFRDILLFGNLFSWSEWFVWFFFGLAMTVGGFVWFSKTRKGFADVI